MSIYWAPFHIDHGAIKTTQNINKKEYKQMASRMNPTLYVAKQKMYKALSNVNFSLLVRLSKNELVL